MKDYLKYLGEEINTTIVATVDDNGFPVTEDIEKKCSFRTLLEETGDCGGIKFKQEERLIENASFLD